MQQNSNFEIWPLDQVDNKRYGPDFGYYHISKQRMRVYSRAGLEVIKIEYSLKLKIKRNDQQPIIALYFEFENAVDSDQDLDL